MTYLTKETAVTRAPISLVVIKPDYCANTFGVSPCTATGVPCYNTYKACADTPHFVKTTKNYYIRKTLNVNKKPAPF